MFKQWHSTKNITHVLMDGGRLSVPFDRLENFYETCVQCIKNNQCIFVVEQKTDIYNFFLDIDYKDDVPLEIDQIKAISNTILTKVRTLYEDVKLIVSVSRPKKKGDSIKTGVHINFPGLRVNQENAVYLMHHVVAALDEVYSSRNWSEFIDSSVYGDPETGTKGSGFRMPWSHKKSKHELCNGNGCAVCEWKGKLTEGQYLPVFLFSPQHPSGEDIEPVASVELLKLMTVRTDAKDSVSIEPFHKKVPRVRRVKKNKEGDFTKEQTKDEIHDEELRALLETYIRKYMKGQERSYVQKIFKNEKSVYVKTNSRFCENISRNHNSNHVWFLIDKEGTICQRCFCTCETTKGRRYGLCKNFSGKKHKLTNKISEIIFPDRKNKNVYLFSGSSSRPGGSK